MKLGNLYLRVKNIGKNVKETGLKGAVLLTCFVLISINGLFAQTAASYNFTRTSGVYTSIVGGPGTVATGAISCDDCATGGIPIGFTFSFCGNTSTQLAVCSNGWISLANDPTVGTLSGNSGFVSTGKLFPYWNDDWGVGHTAYYQTSGVAGSRVFTFEWNTWQAWTQPSGLDWNFQVKLYEGTNTVQFCYGPFSSPGGQPGTIGIGNSPSDYQVLPNDASVTTSTTFTSSCVMPVNGSILTWTTGVNFNNGTPQNLTVCQNSLANNINSLLTASGQTSLTFTWSVTSGPTHGTLAGFPTSVASGTNITPSGLSYTPYSGYSGTDAFTIQVSDGTSTASTTINVAVNPTPAAIGGSLAVCMGSTTTLSNTYGGGTWTSGTPGTATINPVSGLVTPVAPGNTTITYTMPCGSTVTAIVTVNPLPAAIGGGPMNVCVGLNTVLTDGDPGGTWTSSNVAQATVAGGTVTGVSAGTPIITYALPTGCQVTQPVTVNPLPAAITGTLAVCSGLSTTLADASPLGTWTSASPAVATVGLGTGVVNAVGVGPATSVITYTLPTGCLITATVTVNPNPNPIGGTTNVCTGLTTTLNATPALGTWSSSDITLATVGSSSGIVTGVAAGVPTITYTLATGCISTTPVTVNQTPVAITGTTNVCIGSTTTLSDFTAGGTWTSSNPVFASVGAGTGIVTGLANGTLNIVYTMPSGCNTSTAFTVNPLPGLVSGTPNVCVGLTSTLSAAGGGTWTSSNPTLASVGSGSGTVTGVSAGTVNITYTLPTGCYSVTPFTVNPTPAAITGSSTVCEGSTTTLADATSGGTWTSSNGNATVGAGTGIVSGVTAGNVNIIYTLPAGCTATKAMTVNPTPVAISGATTVCVGLTTVLTDGTPGGSWSSSDVTKATVAGGTVSGIAAGTVSITYTLPAGCTAIQPMTVNPTPAAITGTMVVCVNSTTALSDVTPGGTWSSSNNLIASVGTSGIVTGVAAGNANIIYTLGAGCTATAPVTVNAVPNISSFSSPTATSPCVGVNGVVTVNSASLGAGTFTVTYNLSGANTSTGNTATLTMGGGGTGTFTIPSGLLPNTGATTVTITMLTNALGCTSNVISSNTASFAVNALPVAYSVLGTGSYCAGGAGVHVFLATSDGGINYQLFLGASPVGLPVAGTFTTLDMGAQTTAGTYTVVGTNTTTLCTANMSGSATITINPLPTVFTVTGGGSYCAGGAGVLVGLSNSTSGVNYQLYNGPTAVGSPVAGTGGVLSFGLQTGGGIYTVIATNVATGCTNNMSGSATITVNPLPAAITGTAAVCVGLTTTLADATAGGTWSSVNTAVATIGSSSGVATGVASGTSVISYTLPTGCAITTTLTVNPNPSAISGAGAVCTGATLNLTSPTGGGTWTSSNTGEATVGSSTGIVTGVAAGTPTITYTLPTGCIATAQVSVNTTPLAISGTPTVCPGTTTTLTDATIGGSWTSSNIALATVGAGTGVVTGVAAGTVTITYTVSGCTATTPVTVNPTPGAITGTTNVCTGASVTLSSSSPGGIWTSSNIALATVGTGGVVNGIAAGALTISYTLPTGCLTTTSFTVNQTPVGIAGVNNVCVGLTTALSDGTPGGSWSSSNTLLATVGTSGIVTGVAAGSPTITYTTTGSCIATMPITVNPLPASITGASGVCIGSSTTLGDATTGGTWTSSNTVMATIGSSSGVINGLSIGALTITYTLATGCIATMPFTVNSLPAAITGSSAVCVASSTTLSDATGGGTWSSSNPGVASVIGGTGVVTGVSAGTLTITYTLPTGCIAATPMTVNPTPVAITGSSSVCTGLTTTLSDATAGGSWSSSDLTKATVGAGTGIVTGVAVGTLNIIYTLPAGCTAAFPMTVNLQPAAITGSSTVCTSLTTTLSDATSGGSWTSSDPTIASVGAGTGIVTGVVAGTLNITYTISGGCNSVFPMTVNQNPVAITGTFNVCVGSTRTLADASLGGTWTSSNTALATVGSSTGLVTGISAGTVTITYTLPGGCTAVAPFTVNPLPALITGLSVVCVNATITLADGTAGGTWTSSNTLQATVGTGSGVVTGLAAGSPVISYTLPTGCFATMPITVNPLPAFFTVTGGGAYCAGGVGLSVGLSGSAVGINYQLFRGITSIGSPVAGTGSALDFGLQTTAGTYTVVATNTVTGCFVTMSGSALITVNVLPTVFTVAGGGSYCSGGTGVAVTLSSSTIGVNYQLLLAGIPIGSPVAGTNGLISFGLQTAAGVYTVVATNALTLCTANMTGSATISINPLPTVFSVTGGGSYCTGGLGVHIGLSNSSVGVNYSLIRTGPVTVVTLAGTGGALDFGFQTIASTYTVTATNSVTGCTNTMAGSAIITANAVPSIFSVTGGGAFCASGTGVAVGLSSSTLGINYQLFIGGSAIGSPVAGTNAAISFGLQTAPGTYTVVATNPTTTCTSNMTGSAVVTINPLPAIFTVTGGGGFCSGGVGVNIFLSGSVVGVNYQLFRGVTALGTVAGTGSSISFGLQTVAGTYTVVATTVATGCTNTMAGSAAVNVNPLPTAYTVTGGGAYCAGSPGVHVGLTSSDPGINYQLYLGPAPIGGPLAGTGVALDFGFLVAAGTYTIVATNTTTLCTSTMTGSAIITINPAPLIFSITGGGSYCAGGPGVHIGLSNSTGGVTYQLFNGALPVGAPVAGAGVPLDFGFVTSAGTYTIVATITITGCTATMAGTATVVVNPLPPLNIVTGGGAYCSGGTGVHIGLNGSVTGVNYQLYNGVVLSGVAMAGTGSPLDFGFRTTAGTYTVVAANTTTGCTSTMTGSAVITVNPLPTVYSVTGGGGYCAGGAGVHVGLSNSTSGVSYQLNLGGSPIGAPIAGTGAALDFGFQMAVGIYTITAINTTTLCTNNMAGSVAVSVFPLPSVYTVTGGGSYCTGGTGLHVGLSSSNLGINYQLYIGGSPIGSPIVGTNLALDFGLQTAAGTYTVVASSPVSGCTANMTGSATIALNPLPAVYVVTGGGSYCAGGTGVNVGLSGSNAGISYQLFVGVVAVGSPMSGTGAALNFGLQTTPGIYTVVATNATTSCTSNMSSSVSVIANPLPAVFNVTGGGSYCAGGSGVNIGLDGSASGINYQLYNGLTTVGTPVPGTGSLLDFGVFSPGGSYTVVAIDGSTGCTANMAGSASITVSPLPVVYTVTGGGSYCTGGSGLHVGLSSSDVGINYQLYRGITMIGAPVAGTGLALDFGVFMLAGSYSVVATDAVSGCTNNMSGSVTVAVNALPTAFSVTGGGSYCAGGSGYHVGLSGSTFGVSYQLYNGLTAVGAPISGTGSVIDFGLISVAGTYTIVGTNTSTTCTNTMAGSATITINALPGVYSVTGGGSYCPAGAGVHIGLSGSNTGINYQLYRGIIAVGTPVAGNDSTIDFGLQTVAGAYTVVAVNASTGCSTTMAGSVSVAISALPVVQNVTGGGTYCAGGTGVHVSLTGSQGGVNYQLYIGGVTMVGGPIAGTGLPLDLGVWVNPGNYTVVATNATTGCTCNMAGTAVIAINPVPVVYTVTGGGSYCTGDIGLHVGLSGSATGINYQLYRGLSLVGTPFAGTGFPLDFGLQTAAGVYTVVAMNATTSCTSNMASAASIVINPLPVVYSVAGGGSYCAGGPGVNVFISSSETGVNYQLYRGTTIVGSAIAGTGALLSLGLQTTAGTYTVVATNATNGCSRNMVGTAVVTINPLPTAYVVTGGGSYCAGGVGLHVSLSGSVTGTTYQLYRDFTAVGSPVPGTGSIIDFGLQTAGGTYTVQALNATTGCSNTMTGNAVITVNPLPTPFTVTGGGSYCSGTSGIAVGLGNSANGVDYQLYNGGIPVGPAVSGTGTGITFGLQTLAGTYTVVATNATTGCVNDMAGSTNVNIITTVIPAVTVSNGIGDTVCGGTSVVFSAAVINGGSLPAYQWRVNTVIAPSTGSTYTYFPASGDVVSVIITSSAACATPDTATDAMTVFVRDNVLPVVTVTTNPGDTVCQGTVVHFTATPSYGGTVPAYSWVLNGANVGTGTTYSYVPSNNDIVFCSMTSNYQCVAAMTVLSNNVRMNVEANVDPTVTITLRSGAIIGSIIYNDTLTANVSNGGYAPTYQWSINGSLITGATSAVFIQSSLNNNDVVTCYVVNNNMCGSHSGYGTAIIKSMSVGVKPVVNTSSDIRLVPNPNKGLFTIKGAMGVYTDEEITIEITDMLGQMVYSNKVVAVKGEINEKIQLSNALSNGMYIINLRSGSESKVFHMVVEQ